MVAAGNRAKKRPKRSEQLRRSEERFRSFVQASSQVIWTTNERGEVNMAIPDWQAFTGQTTDQALGFGWIEAIHPDDRDRVKEAWASAFASRGIYEVRYRLRRHDGSWRNILARGVPILDEAGQVTEYIGTCIDVTEQTEAQEALQASEQNFRAFFECAAVGMGRVGFADARWIDVNDTFCAMLGYSREFMLATPWPQITHPDDVDLDMIPFRQMAAGKLEQYSVEKRFIHKEGHYVWALLTLSLVRNSEGRPGYEIAVIEDITARKMAEQALHESESQLRGTFDNASVGITLFDRGGRLIKANGKFCEIIGECEDDLRGRSFNSFTHPDDVEPDNNRYMLLMKGEIKSYELEKRYIRKDGRIVWIRVTRSVRSDQLDNPSYSINVVQDVTTRKEAEEELRRAKEDLEVRVRERTATLNTALEELQKETEERISAVEELRRKEQLLIQQSRLAAMGEMIGNIAHQWRQPLNVLGLLIQELKRHFRKGELTESYMQENTQKAMQVIGHMSRTIDDFRDFFRPDRGKVVFKVNPVVGTTVSLLEAGFRAQAITMTVAGDENVVIEGYPNQFSQVILNIIMNARDAFLERKTVNPVITIRIFSEKGCPTITIADNAGGIAEAIIDRIFDPYFTTKGPDKGTGIGLFMSKTIVEKNMGGRLTVRNAAAGAEFRMEFETPPQQEFRKVQQ